MQNVRLQVFKHVSSSLAVIFLGHPVGLVTNLNSSTSSHVLVEQQKPTYLTGNPLGHYVDRHYKDQACKFAISSKPGLCTELELLDKPHGESVSPYRWSLRGLLDGLPHFKTVHAIRVTRLETPETVTLGQPVKLRCLYDTRGDKLQSLSWSKNGREFFRLQPYDRRQPLITFKTPGINLDVTKSKNGTILLTNSTMETAGRYKCEVTGASFQEYHMLAQIRILAASSSASVNFFPLTNVAIASGLLSWAITIWNTSLGL